MIDTLILSFKIVLLTLANPLASRTPAESLFDLTDIVKKKTYMTKRKNNKPFRFNL